MATIPAVITYHKPGTRPPVYVAGTFSEPPWQPHQMDCTTREDGEYDFKKEVYGEPGSQIQYKFRIGDGDWWVLKDGDPTVTDSAGNTNHVLEVKTQEESSHEPSADPHGAENEGHTDDAPPPTFAGVAAIRLQPSLEKSTDDRSGTGTPVSARVAAEVADSAELLHEEVPEREESEGDSSTNKLPEQTQSQQHADDARPAEFSSVASKHLQPSLEGSANDRSGTNTPVPAKVAAEVADSAELLHEEVPERDKSEGKATTSKLPEQTENQGRADDAQRLTFSSVAAKHLQPEGPPDERSGTGTPISARVAAEVADSAELLHEEVPPREEIEGGASTEKPEPTQGQEHVDDAQPLAFASVAAKHLEPEGPPGERSGAGTPVSARVAAEVADSAELLHEEVPEREEVEHGASNGKLPEQTPVPMSEPAESAPEVANTAETLDNGQAPILVLNPPSGGDHLSEVPLEGGQFFDDQEDSIVDKSPLFAHECVGMYQSDQDIGPADEEEDSPSYVAPVGFIDPDTIDPNDPTLERFPSNREEIIDTVRKLETGLEADQASFEGSPHSPVINPSRRGTEDITGDFLIAPPQVPSSPSTRRNSKRSPRGSFGSASGKLSLHSISEAEEPAAEEGSFRPAVVFSNPLKARPEQLKLPAGDEDEGVAFRDGVSPRTVKPAHQPIASPPSSPKTQRKTSAAAVETELDRDKERSMQTVTIHSAPEPGEPDPKQTYPATTEAKGEGHTEALQRSSANGPSESNGNQGASDVGSTSPSPPTARRPSYAEVASSASPPSSDAKPTSATSEASPGTATTTAAQDCDDDADRDSQLGTGAGPDTAQEEQPQQPASQRQQQAPSSSATRVPALHPKKGAGWIRAFFRLLFVDMVGGFFRKMFGWAWPKGKDRARTETETETQTQTQERAE